ncbi:MAG: NAD(P)/FAD-dependent oxidoreductase [Oscillospiraceae bacterium]|nr:NAD(P)/FAD-dependent oxidoreductase [Oscillospiraceae bacterium]
MSITIIGGGAAGLACAAVLSKAGIKNTIIERNPRVGKKLLMTGNGRCNLGHTPLEMSRYHGDVALAEEVFRDWKGSEAFFNDLGLICRTDNSGRIYPYSNTANSVLDTLRHACTHTEFLLNTECTEIPKGTVILATGSRQLTIDNVQLTITKPSLCPIITDPNLTRPLKGIRVIADCHAIRNGKIIKSEYGEVQFNENSLSGICIMNLSRHEPDTISLDLTPEFSIEQLRSISLSGLFHSRITQALEKQPLETIKSWCFPVKGYVAEKAQITAGGVPAKELNPDLSLKARPNIYVIGEAVNVDGDCGGYNLEWAWASAYRAAKSISRNIIK